MNYVERRQLMTALISEIKIYEEKQLNGQWLKSITFKLPIIDEDLNINLDNDEQVEVVGLLVNAYSLLINRNGKKPCIQVFCCIRMGYGNESSRLMSWSDRCCY